MKIGEYNFKTLSQYMRAYKKEWANIHNRPMDIIDYIWVINDWNYRKTLINKTNQP